MAGDQSEVRRLLARIEAEFAAARQGLHGLASGNAKHSFITSKMERIGAYHAELSKLVGSPHKAMGLIVEHQSTQEQPRQDTT